jgi:hypothetical protein
VIAEKSRCAIAGYSRLIQLTLTQYENTVKLILEAKDLKEMEIVSKILSGDSARVY